VQILDRVSGIRLEAMAFPDIEPTRKPELAIANEDFAMGPQIHSQNAAETVQRQKSGVPYALVMQRVQDRRPGISCACRIDQDTNLHPAPGSFPERLGKRQSDLVPVKNVRQQGDAGARLAYRLEHGGVSLIAVDQRFDSIPRQEGSALDYPVDHTCEHLQMTRVFREMMVEVIG
jgi:hypothetical protein